MSNIPELVDLDRSVPNRCFFYGQTPLGGSDACRPEIAADGSILLRSINLSHTVYRVTEEAYLELRQYPQRKVGMWEFVREDDQDADHIASATRAPQFAGRTIGDLTRRLAAKDEEIAKLREAMKPFREVAGKLFAKNYNASDVVMDLTLEKGMKNVFLRAEQFFAVASALEGGAS